MEMVKTPLRLVKRRLVVRNRTEKKGLLVVGIKGDHILTFNIITC